MSEGFVVRRQAKIDAALDKLSREGLKAALLINKQTLDDHLADCRVRIAKLETENHKFRAAENTLDEIVAELASGKSATLGMIAESPDDFPDAHKRCRELGHDLECESDHWRHGGRAS